MLTPVDFTGISDTVDVAAEFTGGREALGKFLMNNIRYPETAIEYGVSGRVYMSLLIDEKGVVKGVQLDKGFELCCDLEAVRIAKSFPPFTPAMKNGVAVASRFRLPIKFEMH